MKTLCKGILQEHEKWFNLCCPQSNGKHLPDNGPKLIKRINLTVCLDINIILNSPGQTVLFQISDIIGVQI